jgi:hypothetical protein
MLESDSARVSNIRSPPCTFKSAKPSFIFFLHNPEDFPQYLCKLEHVAFFRSREIKIYQSNLYLAKENFSREFLSSGESWHQSGDRAAASVRAIALGGGVRGPRGRLICMGDRNLNNGRAQKNKRFRVGLLNKYQINAALQQL